MWFILRLLYENGDALFALSHQTKIIILAMMAFSFVASIVKGAFFLIKFILILALLYFALTYIGVF
ncbi:MAG: hypothetical protein IJI66_01850 [Erysipelotrichaceae bacterium]|nr:hypothetical protein [Erysipelotrichaceae bacterium]